MEMVSDKELADRIISEMTFRSIDNNDESVSLQWRQKGYDGFAKKESPWQTLTTLRRADAFNYESCPTVNCKMDFFGQFEASYTRPILKQEATFYLNPADVKSDAESDEDGRGFL
jgi:hypothetical protein